MAVTIIMQVTPPAREPFAGWRWSASGVHTQLKHTANAELDGEDDHASSTADRDDFPPLMSTLLWEVIQRTPQTATVINGTTHGPRLKECPAVSHALPKIGFRRGASEMPKAADGQTCCSCIRGYTRRSRTRLRGIFH